MARLDNIAISLFVKAAVDGRVEAAGHHFGHIATRQEDIGRVVFSLSLPMDVDLLQKRQDRLVEIRQPIRNHRNDFFFGLGLLF